MAILKSVITKKHGSFTSRIDEGLQKCNPLSSRGIFLVQVDNGVVWGYDSEKYLLDESNDIVRRKPNPDTGKEYV
ncbi:MAG: hypothetical protein OEZ36_04245 [Spirochaetota bacterium]|nr:hypothetical protein [Spirochaetota bacterium]